jgi:membrane-associated phospholipid phosphatase
VDSTAEQAPPAGSRRVAKFVTEALSPAVVVVLLSLAVAWTATGHRLWPALLWAVVSLVFYSVLPMLFLIRGARRGNWDGHWVRDREHRFVPLVMCLASALAGLVIMTLGDAPADVLALGWAMISTLLVCLAITRWWKISVHAAVAGGAVAMTTFLYGPWLLLLVLLVALVCWSRVRLTDHTVGQVVAGALTGPVAGGVVFLLVR